MFENILFILLIAFIIMGVFMIMRGRMNRSLKYSLKMERKRVPKLSEEEIEELRKKAREEGFAEGQKDGFEKGKIQGLAEGKQRAEEQNKELKASILLMIQEAKEEIKAYQEEKRIEII